MPRSGVSLRRSFTLRSPTTTLHEPILIDFSLELENESSGPVHINLGPDGTDHFEFAIDRPPGKIVWAHRIPTWQDEAPDRLYVGGDHVLQPGEVLRKTLLLDEWLRFRRPGLHVVRALLADSLWASSRRVLGRFEPEVLAIPVLPRSAKRLRELCETLSTIVIASSSESQAIADAALALSHVADPIAIPYLERTLIPDKSAWQHTLPGLGRIGTPQAVEVLRSVARGWRREPGGRGLAREILRQLEDDGRL
jgi:hypothetical protein